ncbi:hypothetical protein [Sphingobacterium hotanense]|uniref:hypothetical protein n=1 Tax=Sphingobacterium hotanense TaxID=649196 RepID=UPI0021A7F403|nr:hypothetical protein [Sphingobacterium hotanense]MCT1524610.1 hypothetical protein [Sphingobacterium hotanense]
MLDVRYEILDVRRGGVGEVGLGRGCLNQERKDERIGRIMLKEKTGFVSEPGKKGFKDWQDHVERKNVAVSEPGKKGLKGEQPI